MFAICSVSPHVNGVRKHVRTMRENGWKFRIIQIPTADYRRLHKLKNTNEGAALMAEVQEIEYTHKIDIEADAIHKTDCIHVEDGFVDASITDISTTGLHECDFCGG